MIKFINRTTHKEFLDILKARMQEIKSIESNGKFAGIWAVYDKYENEWKITFTGNVGEFTIANEHDITNPFKVYLYLEDNKVEIRKAIEYKRNITSDRLLRKYSRLATMVSCYHRFGYLKP